jgi:hypothetical protein
VVRHNDTTLASVSEVKLSRAVSTWMGDRPGNTKPPRPTQPSIPPGSVNEYQPRLGVKCLVQQQEKSDRKDRFGSGMAAIGAVWLFIPAVCSL